jgi:hypothetical protein
LPGYDSYSGAILIISSILRIEMAASVANLNCLIFPSIGSKTPAIKLFLHFPLAKSSPVHLNSFFFRSSVF